MPFYEYQCSNCGYELEELQSISAEPLVKCPNCGKDTLKRLIGTGGGLIFKGSGFYLTDYKNKSKESSAKGSAKDSSKKDTTGKEPLTKETSAKETSPAKKDPSKISGKTTEKKSTKKSDKK